ncbi:MAG: tetratricopeptide repeat protein [Candidatus Moduliflexus flocculans]|nr:tetratricopeptide repeat protein [Candidatus Moduliflexus flocculans]
MRRRSRFTGSALAIRERAPGPDHAEVARSLGSLGRLYNSLGRCAEAGAASQALLGDPGEGPRSGPSGIWPSSLVDLAVVHDTLGRYAEAEPLFKRALAIREKAFGPDHPDVAASLWDLALLAYERGRYAEGGDRSANRALRHRREKAYGPEHTAVAGEP